MRRTSIGTWAYNIGPYEKDPIPFDTVGETLAKLDSDGAAADLAFETHANLLRMWSE